MELTSHVVYRGRGHTHCITQELKKVTSSHSIFSISYTIFFPQSVRIAALLGSEICGGILARFAEFDPKNMYI